MKRTNLILIILLAGIFAASDAVAQAYNLQQLLNENQLVVDGREASLSKDKKGAISFDARQEDGVAFLKGVNFSEGTIEVDIRGRDLQGQSFVGIAFHGVDRQTTDVVYFRPFNFQAAEQIRRSHSVQYVSHPQHGWSTLRENFPGKYEKAITSPPDPNDWFHAKIEVKGDKITVYVDNSSTPSLTVTKLNPRTQGQIGLWVGYGSSGDFANLTIAKRN